MRSDPGAGGRRTGRTGRTAGGREPGAGSREPGAGSREPGAGSREPGLPLGPRLCPCLTASPSSPAWSLPLLGQQYLDILTTWYCSFQDCCDGGDCRISNNLTGWDLQSLGWGWGAAQGQRLGCKYLPSSCPQLVAPAPTPAPPWLPATPVSRPCSPTAVWEYGS